ncbi:hypothetical protein [uncultured Kordia sp.]|uniref:hypothetical protein n=1 Tax=uncultured Kordia sp. TaxID=507699 RepID=UPI002601E1A3|nr:hypothetical protein [uncultured Kordia sp.]
MKKKSLKNLKLNKKSISNLDQMTGGKEGNITFTTILPFCFTTLSCAIICVTKLGCPDD